MLSKYIYTKSLPVDSEVVKWPLGHKSRECQIGHLALSGDPVDIIT